jgi:hypothetical protein
MARLAQGTQLKYKAGDGTPLRIGDVFYYEGKTFVISPYGSALDENKEAYPISKMDPSKIILPSEGEMFVPLSDDAQAGEPEQVQEPEQEVVKESTMLVDISLFSDEDIAAELRRRGYEGVLTKIVTLTI